ncbi:MAG TPA: hypothetical protein VF533_13860 [Solirubrobacteraceae bacterium]
MRFRPLLLAALLAAAALPGAAGAVPRLPAVPAPVAGNPADRLTTAPIEDAVYDPATHCAKKPKPGMTRLVAWLDANAEGVNWGTYRCEKWGKGSASLHAEGRAVDWHLDARDRAQRRAGQALIELLLAPDRAGNPQALARRMGVEELIWDCGYWSAGSPAFSDYAVCVDKKGRRRKRVDPTAGHLDHLHIGLSKAGAAARTSFWTAKR